MLDTSVAVRPTVSHRASLVTALLAAWFTVGLLLDAWAHNNLTELETFFTPWHAVFYSGFVATAGWIAWTTWRFVLAGRRGWQAVPVAYASSLVAIAGFGVAGLADLMWHTTFGIEQEIKILFSPSHLALAATMFVIVTTPLRAAWADPHLPRAPGLWRLLPAVVSASLATTLVLLFLQYANALVVGSRFILIALSEGSVGDTADLVTSMAVTNLLLLLPLLLLARRWELPFGAATILYSTLGALSGAITGFRNYEVIVGLVLSGVCVDLIGRWLRPNEERPWPYRAFAALAPLVTWTIYFVVAYVALPLGIEPFDGADGPLHPAVPEVYTGAPVVQALLGLLVGVVLVPDKQRSR